MLVPSRPLGFMAAVFGLMGSASGCQAPNEGLQARLDESSWTFEGCGDLIVTAINQDTTLALVYQLDVDTEDVSSGGWYVLSVPTGGATATLYDGMNLISPSCDGDEQSNAIVDRIFEGVAGEIDATVQNAGNGGRSISADVTDLTFEVGDGKTIIGMTFESVPITGF